MASAEILPGALRDNAVAQAMAEQDFCLAAHCLRSYAVTAGQVGGAAVGGAVCGAMGVTALAAPVCAWLGSWLGGVVARGVVRVVSALGPARGQTLEEQELDVHRDYLENGGPEQAGEAMLAATAYGLERAAAVETIARGMLEPRTISRMFSERGAPTLEEAAALLNWNLSEPAPLDLSGFPRGDFHFLEDPGKNHPLWAEWKIASALNPHGVGTLDLQEAIALLYPPIPRYAPPAACGGRIPCPTVDVIRGFQQALREAMATVREEARRTGYVQLPETGERVLLDVSGLEWFAPLAAPEPAPERKGSWGKAIGIVAGTAAVAGGLYAIRDELGRVGRFAA